MTRSAFIIRTTRIQAVETSAPQRTEFLLPSDQRACGASNRMMSNWWTSVKTAIHWVMGGRLARDSIIKEMDPPHRLDV